MHKVQVISVKKNKKCLFPLDAALIVLSYFHSFTVNFDDKFSLCALFLCQMVMIFAGTFIIFAGTFSCLEKSFFLFHLALLALDMNTEHKPIPYLHF